MGARRGGGPAQAWTADGARGASKLLQTAPSTLGLAAPLATSDGGHAVVTLRVGYRVDDVHLTSYKVLHNLNRTDAGGGKKGRDADGEDGGMDGDDSDAEDGAGGRTRRQKRGGGTADTLESNLGELTYIKIYV